MQLELFALALGVGIVSALVGAIGPPISPVGPLMLFKGIGEHYYGFDVFDDFDEGFVDLKDGYIEGVDRSIALYAGRGIKVCFGFWKFKGCLIFTKSGSRIRIRATIFGATVFDKKISIPSSFTIRIKRGFFPFFIRWLMKSDLKIRISGINLWRLRACLQLRVKIRCGFLLLSSCTKKFPSPPYCVDF